MIEIIKPDEILNEILNDDIIVYENIKNDTIWINFNKNGYIIKQNSLKNEPINTNDYTIRKYYNNIINYLDNIDKNIIKNINSGYWFNFEFINDNVNLNISKKPLNNLILYSVFKGNKFADIIEVIEYSKMLNVDHIPVIYYGKIPEYLKIDIKMFLNTSMKDLKFIFGHDRLSVYFYNMIMNHNIKSFIYNFDNYDNIINRIIIKTKNNYITLKQLDDIYLKYEYKNNNIYNDFKYLIFDFIIFCQNYDLDKIKLKGYNKNEIKLNLLCRLFNSYINEIGYDIINSNISKTYLIDNKLCIINKHQIKNPITKNNICDPTYSYIFYILYKTIIEKDKIFGDDDDEYYNKLFDNFMDNINKRIDKYMNVMNELRLIKHGLIDSENTIKIKYDKDGSGKVYPNVKKNSYNTSVNKNKKYDKGADKKFKK